MVAIYCRVSSMLQAEHGNIQAQVDYAEKYCDLNQLEHEFYLDDGITGVIPLEDRPAGAKLLEAAAHKAFDAVYVYKIDRLGRNTRVILNAIHQLEGLNITVKSMTEPFDTSNPSGRFMLTMLAGVADLERSNIIERMLLGRHRSAQNGKYPQGKAPYGYSIDSDGKLILNESEAAVVRRIYELYLQGGVGVHRIVNILNDEGIPTRTCRPRWEKSMVMRILQKPLYTGVAHTKYAEIPCPAIVPPEMQIRVRDVAQMNKTNSKRNTKTVSLLRTLIVCAHCGRHYSTRTTTVGEKSFRYYVCSRRAENSSYAEHLRCYNSHYKAERLEDEVWEQVNQRLTGILNGTINGISNVCNIPDERPFIEKKIKKCDIEREKLLDLYRNDIIEMKYLKEQLDGIEKRKTELKAQLSDITKKIETAPPDISEYRELLSQIADVLKHEPTFEQKFQILRLFVRGVYIDGDSYHIKYVI